MVAVVLTTDTYSALATSVLVVHALFILWVIFGAFLARSRPILRWLHIASLIWGILTELLLWPCPLTRLEDWLESKAGIEPYQGGFLLHYLDKVIYPFAGPKAGTRRSLGRCSAEIHGRIFGGGFSCQLDQIRRFCASNRGCRGYDLRQRHQCAETN